MSFLLDTNVVSDLRRPQRTNDSFRVWFGAHATDAMYLSAITIGEIEQGVSAVERRDGDQGALLREWFEERVLAVFATRSIAVDAEVARVAAQLRVPDPTPWVHSIIAATARVHDLTLVTRNTEDFAGADVPIVNPWGSV